MKYEIRLIPMGPFFFGGEHTFGADEERGEKSRYHAKSNRFPAQSALIGMLRHTLLASNDLLTAHKRGTWVDKRVRDRAVEIAGNSGFRYDRPVDLGAIESLSPLFIERNGVLYTSAPVDFGLEPIEDKGVVRYDHNRAKTIVFEGYDAKEGLEDRLLGSDGKPKTYEDLFTPVSSVGIKKSRTGQTEEEGFFLKESYEAKEGSHFLFYLETDGDLLPEKTLVALGADRSPFMLESKKIEETPENIFDDYIPANGMDRIVTLSETLLSPEAAQHCTMILGRRIRQRQIADSRPGKFEKTPPFFRYERGAVLYTDKVEGLSKMLAKPYLKNAGINHFVIKTAKQGE